MSDFKQYFTDDFEEWWGSTSASDARRQIKCRLKATACAAWNHQQYIIDSNEKLSNERVNWKENRIAVLERTLVEARKQIYDQPVLEEKIGEVLNAPTFIEELLGKLPEG